MSVNRPLFKPLPAKPVLVNSSRQSATRNSHELPYLILSTPRLAARFVSSEAVRRLGKPIRLQLRLAGKSPERYASTTTLSRRDEAPDRTTAT